MGKGCFVGANAVLAHDLADGEAFVPGRGISELRHRGEYLEDQMRCLDKRARD
jgi:hypothetical protein